MRIYVAARFHEKDRVKGIYQDLKRLGHEITVDWTMCQTQRPFSEHINDARSCAIHTIEGVEKADIFIYLSHAEIGAGSSAELGAALISYQLRGFPRIYAVGPYRDNNLCLYHPAVQYVETIEQVFADLKNPTFIIPTRVQHKTRHV